VAALLAWAARGLTGSGAVVAWLVGTLVLLGTGWGGGLVLAAFFVSSTLVSRLAPAPAELDPKGNRRDARQVAANGGAAALLALAGLHDPGLGLWLVTGTLAAAAADTWATAIGGLSRTPPRSVAGWRPVPRGTSGGVTLAGSAGAAAGAALVSAAAVTAGGPPAILPLGTLVGFLGMAADSLLGATLQARFHCPACDRPSEWPVHRCGTPTIHRGGLRWLDNDAVNAAATALAAALALAAWAWRCPCA
jgi:uncharacterized protein (TIGR00297 family)